MRWISLPDELSLSHLLDLRDVAHPLRGTLSELPRQLEAGRPDHVLVAAGRAFGQAKGQRDRYGEALALLYQAEAYRRLERWEDGLDAIRAALHWLELQVATTARYNEAMAVYVEGVIHFTLGARERTVETFSYAQHVLRDSERTWGYEHNGPRVADCRNVTGWITDLQEVQARLPVHGPVVVVPVYALMGGKLIRTGAIAVEGARVTMPGETLAAYLPADLRPVRSGECVFPCLYPPSRYVAIRTHEPKTMSDSGYAEELVIVEVSTTEVTGGRSTAMGGDDGVVQRSWVQDLGIPRVLVRRRGEMDE